MQYLLFRMSEQAFTRMVDLVVSIAVTTEKSPDTKNNIALKHLYKWASNGGIKESSLAVMGIVKLIKADILSPSVTLHNLLADVTSARSPGPFIRAITDIILLQFLRNSDTNLIGTGCNSQKKIDPYGALLMKRSDIGNLVLDEVRFLLGHSDDKIKISSLQMIRPLVMNIFCIENTLFCTAIEFLEILVSTRVHEEKIILLLVEVFSLIPISTEKMKMKLKVMLALADIAIQDKLTELKEALLPCLATAISLAWNHNLGTYSLESYLNIFSLSSGRGNDDLICTLAIQLPQVSGRIQVFFIKIALRVLAHKDGNPLIASHLLPSLLQVLTSPCNVVSKLTSMALALVALIQSVPVQNSISLLKVNKYWQTLQLGFPSLVLLESTSCLCDHIIHDPKHAADWLLHLTATSNQTSHFHMAVVKAVFLYQGSTAIAVIQALKVLEKESSIDKTVAVDVLAMVLYRLGREKDPNTVLALLYTLPSLAVNKLCVALVVKTLLALAPSTMLRPMVMRIMLDVWRVEPRTYQYLSKLINERINVTPQLEMSRVFVITSVCKEKPSLHGEDLVPLLSQYLNNCGNEDGTALTTLALDGIYHLCANHVIDLRTTWHMIGPKLMAVGRPEVTVALCCLLTLVPDVAVESPEFEIFIDEILCLLWGWTQHECVLVFQAAYVTLAKFNYDRYRFKMLPSYMRVGHKLPSNFVLESEQNLEPEDVLTYVPGLAWVKLVTECETNRLFPVGDFLQSLVVQEVMGLSKGVYLRAVTEAKKFGLKGIDGGQPEPLSYNFLPDSSILKGLVQFLLEFPKHLDTIAQTDKLERLLRSVLTVLTSLAQSLRRPLPALDWRFLDDILNRLDTLELSVSGTTEWRHQIRHTVFRLTAQQSNKSPSAAKLVSSWLVPAPVNCLSRDDELVLFGVLDLLGRGIAHCTLQPFIEYIFQQHEQDISHLTALLHAIKSHLKSQLMQDSNRDGLCSVVESLSELMDPLNCSLFAAYLSVIAELPTKSIERLTSPSLWWEVTGQKLEMAAVVRCHVAVNADETDMALVWLNDIIDAAAAYDGERHQVLLVIAEALLHCDGERESTAWFLQLLGRLHQQVREGISVANKVEIHLGQPNLEPLELREKKHNCRLKFYLDLVVMCLSVWSGQWDAEAVFMQGTNVLGDTFRLAKQSSKCLMQDDEGKVVQQITIGLHLTSSIVALCDRPVWADTLNQLLTWLVLYGKQLTSSGFGHYELTNAMHILALLNKNLSPAMWLKVLSNIG